MVLKFIVMNSVSALCFLSLLCSSNDYIYVPWRNFDRRVWYVMEGYEYANNVSHCVCRLVDLIS
jgi:hypothetical protein